MKDGELNANLALKKYFLAFYFISFLKILFIYSWETHRERQRHRQREKQAPRREPNVGLDPPSPGSCPAPKAGG